MINRPNLHAVEDTAISPLSSQQKSAAKWMRAIGTAEGISFLLLLFVAMPIKYIGHNPIPVRLLGPIHGGLFLLYIASALGVARILRWRWFHIALSFVASVIPFGPFAFEAWLHRTSKSDA